jgi:hypothetical protein
LSQSLPYYGQNTSQFVLFFPRFEFPWTRQVKGGSGRREKYHELPGQRKRSDSLQPLYQLAQHSKTPARRV